MIDYTESPDYLALVRSVILRPDDDLPRLIVADWLDENGWSCRANCIREALAGNPMPYDFSWPDGKIDLGKKHSSGGYWHRGFCSKISWNAALNHDKYAKWMRLHPVTEIIVYGKSPHAPSPDGRFGWQRVKIGSRAATEYHTLVAPVWDRLGGDFMQGAGWKTYRTMREATAQMERAIHHYARSLADLPELIEKT